MKVVDMHCDTISRLLDQEKGWTLADNDLHIRLDKMKAGDYLLQNFALFIYGGSGKDLYREAMRMADCFDAQIKLYSDRIVQVRSWEDIEKNAGQGRILALLTIEEGGVFQGSLKKLRTFYDRGVRMVTLTWNFPNEIGWPNLERPAEGEKQDPTRLQTQKGLTEFGFYLVEEMERLGMIPDVSHLSDAGFWDVISHAKKPFVASHSNARAVCHHVRNLTDEMIRALAQKGGVMGLNFCPDFLETAKAGDHNEGTVEAVVRHAKHIVNTGGIECLGLGSDFDGIPTHRELTGADRMPLLDEALRAAGFPASQREKIFSGNVLRLYKDCLGGRNND